MKKNIITVSRQFGSGGRTIGRTVAQRLGIPCYDKELVDKVALESGFDPKFVEERGEANDFLWTIQYNVILSLAEKGPCVIVGRCADYILKDRPDCLHTFIHASPEFRADRIVRLYGESEVAPEKRLSDKDTRRANNYRHYTGREWGTAQNYHLCLDSSVIGVEKCADIILDLVKDSENT